MREGNSSINLIIWFLNVCFCGDCDNYKIMSSVFFSMQLNRKNAAKSYQKILYIVNLF